MDAQRPMETESQASARPARAGPLKTILNLRHSLFSAENLTKKAYLNAIATSLDYAARFLVGFVVNPMLVSGLGVYLYGVWQVLDKLRGSISAASGRPTEALKWAVAYRQTSTDYEEKRRILGSAVVVWFLFLPVLSALCLTLAWFAPVWLKAPPEYLWVVRLAAGVMMLDLIITSLVDVPESVLRGENLGYKRMGLTTLIIFVQGGTIAGAVYLNYGIVGVAVALLANTLIAASLFLLIARSYVPWFGIGRPSRQQVREFLGLSWWFVVWRVVMKLMMGSDVVVLGFLGSAQSVTTYSLTKYIPETLISLVAIVMGGITPGLGGVIGSGNLEKVTRVRNEFLAGTWLLATAAGTTMLLWDRSFVRLWVGEQHYAGSLPVFLIMLSVVQFVLIRNDANIINLTLNLRRMVLTGALSSTISIVLAGVLLRVFHLGISGLCLGMILGRLILSLGYPWMIGRLFGVPLASQLRSALKPIVITLLLFVLVATLSGAFVVRTWLLLVPAVGSTLAGVSLLAFYAGLSSGQRERLWRRVRVVRGTQGR